MKCSSCAIDISPGYTKALNENTCPACGSKIMTESLFKEFGEIKVALADSAVVEADLVKVASLITGKYRLVPKDAMRQPGTGRFEQKPITRVGEAKEEVSDRDADLVNFSPEIQAREKALRDAEEEKIAAEWNLTEGELSSSAVRARNKSSDITQEHISQDVMDLASIIGGNESVGFNVPSGPISSDPFEAQRMARLADLKSDPAYRAVRRAGG